MNYSRKLLKYAVRMIINISLISNGLLLLFLLVFSPHVCLTHRYISILVELTRLEGTKHGHLISLQMLDVAVRVESIRPFACNQMVKILA